MPSVFLASQYSKNFWFSALKLNPDEQRRYHLYGIFHYQHLPKINLLQAALECLVRSNYNLRSVFLEKDQELNQLIADEHAVKLMQYVANTEEEYQSVLEQSINKPFDLEAGPLYRFILIDKSYDQTSTFVPILHHIIIDGTQFDLLMQDLGYYYHQLECGQKIETVKALNLKLLQSYLAKEKQHISHADPQYWVDKLEQGDLDYDLPVLGSAQKQKKFQEVCREYQLDSSLYKRLNEFSKASGYSVFHILKAVWAVLISAYTNQDKLVITFPFNTCRKFHKELKGAFVNTLFYFFERNGTFLDHLKKQKQEMRQLNHWYVSTFDILSLLGKHATFPFAFSQSELLINGPVLHTKPSHTFQVGLTGAELYFLYQEMGNELHYGIVYRAGLFDQVTLNRVGQHVETLLMQVLNDPHVDLKKLSCLDHDEYHKVTKLWNSTDVSYPLNKSILQLFAEQVQKKPHAPAVQYEGQLLSYKALDDQSTRLALYLQNKKGVREGSKVGVCVARSLDLIVSLLAALKASATYVPLDPLYPPERLSYMAQDSECQLILSQSSILKNSKQFQSIENVVLLDRVQSEIDEIKKSTAVTFKPKKSKAHLAYIVYTSGTTGEPKGVMIPQSALVNFILSMRDKLGFSAEDKILGVTTYSFDISSLELFLPLISGGQCVICSTEKAVDPDLLKQEIAIVQPTIMQATPITWTMLFLTGWKNKEKVKVLCGGEVLTEALKQQFLNTDTEAWNMYGPTETTVWSTMQKIEKDQLITVGQPIANTQVYILNANLKPTPVGIPGELYISGAGLADGYFNKPALTAERFISHPLKDEEKLYRTGDLARWTELGQIEVLGRIDQQVKVRGFRIELGEIETQLNQYPGVANSVVLLHEEGPIKKLVAYYVYQGQEEMPIKEVRLFLKRSLPHYMIPQAFIRLEAFPLTPSGKVDKKQLKAVHSPLTPTLPNQSLSQLELQITEIFSEELNNAEINPDDGFFDLGGNSFTALVVVEKIRKKFSYPLTVTAIFKYPTVQKLSQYLNFELSKNKKINRGSQQTQERQNRTVLSGNDPAYYDQSLAIIGISCQLPDAEDHNAFWNNLKAGKESVRFLSKEELLDSGARDDLIHNPSFISAQVALLEKEMFDAGFFNISPRDAELMDPQFRLLLLNSWKAIEDAGYDVDDIPETSVFMSSGNNFYQALFSQFVHNITKVRVLEQPEEYVAWLLAQGGSIPTMISNKLGLKGPSLYVHSNCSSSLVGLHLAYQSLMLDEAKYALVGASTIFPGTTVGYLHQDGLNFSSTGHCKTFDASADGMTSGEGAAVILVKKAVDAIKDQDHIYALIRGVGVNNDGADKAGFYAPSIQGQSAVIQKVLEQTQINPGTISYVEAHGTGTKIGDPIELSALTDAYRRYTDQKQYCGIGSVKTNIGHLDTASGLVGLIKVALSLKNGEIPPTLNYTKANPEIDFTDSPFYVVDELQRLESTTPPYRAAISSFGIGGTNAHAILEQYTHHDCSQSSNSKPPFLIVLSAKTQEQLKMYASALLDFINYHLAVSPFDLAYTLQVGRKPMQSRLAFLIDSIDDLKHKLKHYLSKHDLPLGGFSHEIKQSQLRKINKTEVVVEKETLPRLAELWVQGALVDWKKLYGLHIGKRLSLPVYPFAKKRYWIEEGGQVQKELAQYFNHQDMQAILFQHQQTTKEMNQILLQLLLSQLIKIGLLKTEETPRAIKSRFVNSPTFSKWIESSLDFLRKEGLILFDGEHYQLKEKLDAHKIWQEWEQKKKQWQKDFDFHARVILLDTVIQAIPDILLNQVSATQVMFPRSSLSLVEGVYKNNAIVGYFNEMLASKALVDIKEWLERDPSKKIRILEIGAGTGSSSEKVLQYLDPIQQHIAEYCYTDVSKAFLINAEKQYGENRPYLTYQIFNADFPPQDQGLEFGVYDLVIATNVLHATKSVLTALKHAKALLRKDGVILLHEINENSLWMHLTFGLLDGWWLYHDDDLRIPGGPAIAFPSWAKVLTQAGFHFIHHHAKDMEELGLQVISAKSDGVVNIGNPKKETQVLSVKNNLTEKRVESTIVKKLSESLKLDIAEIDYDESFADYGLDSLTGVNLVDQLNQALLIDLEVTCLFDYPTVNELQRYIKDHFSLHDSKSLDCVEDEASHTIAPQAGINEPIAIIGMSGRFPQAQNLDELWQHLARGTDLVQEVKRWDLSAYNIKCTKGGFLKDISQFDPLFFNISGLEATYMEPQQRIFLEESWKALEDAGYAGHAAQGQQCGVFVGCCMGDYLNLKDDDYPAQGFWGNLGAVIPARISYYLNLKGPAIAVDTACSSSLVSIHLACQSLWNRETNMALAGGVFIMCTPRLYIAGDRAGMLSPTGHCHAFDNDADGFVPAEGAGVLILKRLQDAMADGDHIYGVIRGTGVNQDGKTNGITAPSANSQERLEQEVYDKFKINPEEIQMVEAHGTGTKLGDPIEFQALSRTFRRYTDKQGFCALGSIKTNIGHAQLAAGVAGVIKILLSLKNKQIPPSLHYKTQNTNISLAKSPFYINTDLQFWDVGPSGQRAAVTSSFGASGTNAHLVIEEAPEINRPERLAQDRLIALSAETKQQLRQQVLQLLQYCDKHEQADCGDISYTLLLGRRHLQHRFACVVQNMTELKEALTIWMRRGDFFGQNSKLRKLAEQFIRGEEVETALLFSDGGYRRIALPTYPFLSDVYWLPDSEVPSQQTPPLLQEQFQSEVTKDCCYLSTFTGQEFFFSDHKVGGRSLLPGTVYLEMAREAVMKTQPRMDEQALSLENIVWLRPLVFEGKALQVYTVVSTCMPIQFEIYSIDPAGQNQERIVHCKGEAIWGEAVNEHPSIDLQRILSACHPQALTVKQFYENARELGIEYGETFQGVQKIYVGQKQVLAELTLPELVQPTLSQYLIHPSLVDCAFQCIKYLFAETSNVVNLLFGVQALKLFKHCSSKLWAWIRYADSSKGKEQSDKINIDLCDDQGKIYLRINGVSIRAMPRETQQLKSNIDLLVPAWKPVRLPSQPVWPAHSEKVVMVGGGKNMHDSILERYPSAVVANITEADDIKTITDKLNALGDIAHLIWITPYSRANSIISDAVIDAQQRGVLMIFRILKALLQLGYSQQQLGLTFFIQEMVVHSSIYGLVGSLTKEYPNWKVRVVDAGWVRAFDKLFELPADPDGNALQYRHTQWFEQSLTQIKNQVFDEKRIKKNGVYVIIGGAGGIGEAISEYLVRRYQAQVVWIGRKAKNAVIQAKVDRLAQLGPAPYYVAADATDLDSLQQARDQIKQQFNKISGLFQAALVFSGTSLDKMTEQQFQDVMQAKVDVSLRMTQVFQAETLDFILFISSINSFLKAIGQSNYAAGCAFQDAFALQLNQELPYPVKVINLGYCFNNATTTDDMEQRKADELKFIQPSEIIEAIEILLSSSLYQMILIKRSNAFNLRGMGIERDIQTVKGRSEVLKKLTLMKERMKDLNSLLIE